jgi:superfamily II DNA or RNA helicase
MMQKQMCQLTTRDDRRYRFTIEDRFDDFEVDIDATEQKLRYACSCRSSQTICPHIATALLQLRQILDEEAEEAAAPDSAGERYTREEMIRRVLKERHEKAEKEVFELAIGDNIHGFHEVATAAGARYQITIRDFETNNGYCSCPDFRTNKLGTCKHLIYAVMNIKKKLSRKANLKKQEYPFIEIFCDPLNEYHIACYSRGEITEPVEHLLKKYFAGSDYIMPDQYRRFLSFLHEAREHKKILVRPEVWERIDRHFENEEINGLQTRYCPDFSKTKLNLLDFQKEGVLFSLFRKGNIIADEMGLGKTIQAITIAVFKKDIYDFQRVLVVCPASLKSQWKNEIEKFSNEKAVIISGGRKVRGDLYQNSDAYFLITNYEAVLRDITVIGNHPPDLVILDEAQRIKNYETKTSTAVKSIPRKHSLVITGTPIENRLIDLYSVMNFIDPYFLAPLWEFSMNHCYFDKSSKNKIRGYFNLQALKQRLSGVVIRREKSEVLEQLPAVQEMTVPVELTVEQKEIHSGFARALIPFLRKKHKTIYDMQRIFQLLTSMRMVCDSTFLIDKETHFSPKLSELEEILAEKLDILRTRHKVLIFSEWKTMLGLIEKLLQRLHIPYVLLCGDVPVEKRGKLVEEFNGNPDCLVFLSTEAGGVGLNLQAADTVINFELPWNPAKKNQRIGRIHRLGQKSPKLTVINLVALDSIEERIAAGIELKESLFDAVLNEGDLTDEVDFSTKGRSTVIEQVEKMVSPLLIAMEGEAAQEMEISPPAKGLQLPPYDTSNKNVLAEDFCAETDAASREESLPVFPAAATDRKSEPVSRPEGSAAGTANVEEMEQTLNQGMLFLSGIMKMATGKELLASEKAIQIDRKSGEVVMRFRLPGF